MYECDELKIYRGREIRINKKIVMTIPTLDQIEDFGEKRYFGAVHTLTSVGADLKWQLWEIGQDYTKIEDYDLFVQLISQLVGSKKRLYNDIQLHPEKYVEQHYEEDDLVDMLVNPLELILKDIDLADFMPWKMEKNNQVVLYNPLDDIVIDRLVYSRIVEIVRKLHGFKRNGQIPANETTKMDLIEDARDEFLMVQNKPFKSVLLPLISTLQVKCGQCGDEKVWDMPISAFFENVKRIGKIQDAQLLLQGAYSGFANLKGIDKSRLDMFGDIGIS